MVKRQNNSNAVVANIQVRRRARPVSDSRRREVELAVRCRVDYITENWHEFITEYSEHHAFWCNLYSGWGAKLHGVLRRMRRLHIYKLVARDIAEDVRCVHDWEVQVLGRTLRYLGQLNALEDLSSRV